MKKSALMIMAIVFILIISNTAMAGGRYHYDRGHYNHHHNGRGNHYPEAVLGGLIVGGIIGSSFDRPYYRRPVYVNTNPVAVATGSNFLLKSNGNCFLITNNSNGNQILSSVPDSNCK